ncbi:MAG: hypothetical protein JEZ03_08235 [Bacteroidales bacterium]|nr:hypothetical protein [Bacteroidales bacterium]
MKSNIHTTYADQMNFASLAINNGLKHEFILEAITPYGYGPDKLNEGLALYKETHKLYIGHSKKQNNKTYSTANLYSEWKLLNTAYIRKLKIARIVFENNTEAQISLQLKGKRDKNISNWMDQASTFYSNILINPTFIEMMNSLLITEDQIRTDLHKLENLRILKLKQDECKGIARQAKLDRDVKFKELKQWLNRYLAVARFALEDSPQMMESLGVTVAS